MKNPRKRILFFAEAATLSHVVRPWVLARGLDPDQYRVFFASDPRYMGYLGLSASIEMTIPLRSASTENFLRNLNLGKPLFDEATLEDYVRQDLEIIDSVRPDLIVGDLRLSLSISARLRGVRYLNLCNAYWDPKLNASVSVPDIPLRRALGRTLAQPIFNRTLSFALQWHGRPLKTVARKWGISLAGRDIRDAYTGGDMTLYCDPASLFPASLTDGHHAFIGPVRLTGEWKKPLWWDSLGENQRFAFVSLGSSGNLAALETILTTLSGMRVPTIVTTLGKGKLTPHPNTYYADFLPIERVAARSGITICNGGSSFAYEALAAGSPVFGLPSNLDQYLSMHYLTGAGVAQVCETAGLSSKKIKRLIEMCLEDTALHQKVKSLQTEINSFPTRRLFSEILASQFGHPQQIAA